MEMGIESPISLGMKMYDEIEYWRRRRFPNHSTKGTLPKSSLILDYIKRHLENNSKVLDFGAGVGRTFPACAKVSHLECFDITDKYAKILAAKAKGYKFDFSFTLGHTIGVTPYKDKEFDTAIACQVLLHQKPQNIRRVMAELIRVANKVIVISGQVSETARITENTYCFHHKYLKICRDNKWKYFDVEYQLSGDRLVYKFVYKSRGQ